MSFFPTLFRRVGCEWFMFQLYSWISILYPNLNLNPGPRQSKYS
jgi:hypothetical protein